MRQMLIHAPQGQGGDVLDIALRYNGVNLGVLQGSSPEHAALDIVIVHLPNVDVGPFIEAIETLPELHISLLPTGVLTLQPPASEAAEQVTDVSLRSAFEVYIDGLQSIGSWKGFLSFAALAGIVVWLGLFTNTVFLLIAAMLLAPFAGPAMNAAIATARGDLTLLWHSLARYGAALAVSAFVAGLFSWLFRQDVPTQQMASVANISSAAAILPLAAGAAGALYLCQAERSSLVSGASVGVLVAASLAPPTGLVGMGAVIGRWDMVVSGLFLLGIQLVGINISGALVFRLYGGLRPEGPRFERGKGLVTWVAMAVTIVGLASLVALQFGSPEPEFRRATIEQRVRSVIGEVVAQDGEVELAEASVRFTRAEIEGQNTLLAVVYAQRSDDAQAEPAELEERLTANLRDAIEREGYNVTPLVAVMVLD